MPSENATEEAHANFLCRLWDFERPRPQIPIPRHRKVFVVVCCCVCLQGARPRGARAPRRPLATGCAGGGRPNVRKRGARCTRTPKKRILLRRIAPCPLGQPIEIHQGHLHIYARPGTEPNGPAIAPRGPRPRGCCCPLPRRSPSLRAWSAPSLRA